MGDPSGHFKENKGEYRQNHNAKPMRILQKSLINDKKTKQKRIRNINKRLWLESRTLSDDKVRI